MSATWRPLPDGLPEAAQRLTERLRGVKDASGLSLAQLAARTHYSKASWERWLNGKRLITPQALESLATIADIDLPRLLALRDEAEAAGSEAAAPPAARKPSTAAPGTPTAQAVTPAEPPVLPKVALWRRPPVLFGAALAAVLAAASGFWLLRSPQQPGASAGAGGPAPCLGVGCAGKDPQLTGCGIDARTLLTANDGKVVLYLHYSPRCRAAWASLTDGEPGDTATITTGSGDQQTALIHWGYDNYSAMVDASNPKTTLQVCGVQPQGRACTLTFTDAVDQPWDASTGTAEQSTAP